MFIGEYHHTMDEKGRLTIPSKFREELKETFIITRGLDHCLFIYSKEEWNQVVSKYKELPNIKDARNFMRFFLAGASEVELDKQGRINIAAPLVKYAGLEKECIIIGVNDRLEVWSRNRWEEFIKMNEDSFSDLADNLFASNIPL